MDIAAQLAAMPPLDEAALRRDVECLNALGPRFAGTEGEARARELIRAELAAALPGAVHEEPFDHLAYRPGRATCEVAGSNLALPCAGLQSTAAGVVEAEAIYVGAGDTETIEMLERGVGPGVGDPQRAGPERSAARRPTGPGDAAASSPAASRSSAPGCR
jgi:hypothetical protein